MEQKAKHQRVYNCAKETNMYALIMQQRCSVYEHSSYYESPEDRDKSEDRFRHLGDKFIAKYDPNQDFESQWIEFHIPDTLSQLGIPFAGDALQPTIGEVETTLQGQMS